LSFWPSGFGVRVGCDAVVVVVTAEACVVDELPFTAMVIKY
jgi:hypothetical protein